MGQVFGDDVTIPVGTECQSVTDESLNNEVVYFNTNEDLVITAGNLSGDVSATEGRSGSETLGTSDGNAYQQFNINASPIFDGTLGVCRIWGFQIKIFPVQLYQRYLVNPIC